MYPAACPSEEPILLAFIACPHPRASSRAADFPTRAASSTKSAPAPPKSPGWAPGAPRSSPRGAGWQRSRLAGKLLRASTRGLCCTRKGRRRRRRRRWGRWHMAGGTVSLLRAALQQPGPKRSPQGAEQHPGVLGALGGSPSSPAEGIRPAPQAAAATSPACRGRRGFLSPAAHSHFLLPPASETPAGLGMGPRRSPPGPVGALPLWACQSKQEESGRGQSPAAGSTWCRQHRARRRCALCGFPLAEVPKEGADLGLEPPVIFLRPGLSAPPGTARCQQGNVVPGRFCAPPCVCWVCLGLSGARIKPLSSQRGWR